MASGAPDNRATQWIKSSRSIDSANCVEVAARPDGLVVRDSKDPQGPVLSYARERWREFIVAVRRGEFDTLIE